MSRWDEQRAKAKGTIGKLPRCRKCDEVSVLDPCRACATVKQLASYPELDDSTRRASGTS